MVSWQRAPAVAGAFYPEEKEELESQLASLCPTGLATENLAAVLVPHAGYQYSGKTAGKVYSQIDVPQRVILLGPNHTGQGRRVSVWARGTWETPIGAVPIDEPLADALLKELGEKPDVEAHLSEHALEVQVPFLKWRNPDVSIVPITLGPLRLDGCERVGSALARVLRVHADITSVLVVISTDMTHFLDAAEARRRDMLALRHVEEINAAGLYSEVVESDISMCGYIPTTAVLHALRSLGTTEAKVIAYSHSGEVSGDFRRVVGYAGALFPRPESRA